MTRDILVPALFALGSALFLAGNLILIWRAVHRSAVLAFDDTCRLVLERATGAGRTAAWLMCNPSRVVGDLAIAAPAAQRLAEKIARDVARFEAGQGVPVAYALVLMDAAGTTKPFYQTEGFDGAKSPGRGGWRGFLALAGARLLAVAVEAE